MAHDNKDENEAKHKDENEQNTHCETLTQAIGEGNFPARINQTQEREFLVETQNHHGANFTDSEGSHGSRQQG